MKLKDKYALIDEIQSAVALYCYDHDDQNFEITLSVRVRDGWANVEDVEDMEEDKDKDIKITVSTKRRRTKNENP